jgi:hypothetical protein
MQFNIYTDWLSALLLLYLIGVSIDYIILVQDVEMFIKIAGKVLESDALEQPARKRTAKVMFFIFAFFAALIWPYKLVSRGNRS